jgi:hypothetical protein
MPYAPDVEIDLLIKAETDNAFLVSDGDRDAWLPKSQIDYYEHEVEIGNTITFMIPEWLAVEEERKLLCKETFELSIFKHTIKETFDYYWDWNEGKLLSYKKEMRHMWE